MSDEEEPRTRINYLRANRGPVFYRSGPCIPPPILQVYYCKSAREALAGVTPVVLHAGFNDWTVRAQHSP
eukprot:7694725-Pyramimonas_sp.AAC.1